MLLATSLPALIQRTQALAALDLILSPEWEYRYYSFNSAWSAGEKMASMRNGSGDEWWLVFHESGWAALKGMDHESDAWEEGREALSREIQQAFPPELHGFAHEPAFRWDETGFGAYYLPSSGAWKFANDATSPAFAELDTGCELLLEHVNGTAEDYAQFASDYNEVDVPVEIVEAIFAHQPITEEMVAALNPEVKLEDIAQELYGEIGYGKL
ncbi:MAG: hypothetical protein ACAI34_08890 [Verrucomicrobium sp.]